MNKNEALQKLKEHGIELVLVTERVYTFDQQDLARKDYDIPEDCIVPTKEQHEKIISIIGQDGLYAIMEEYITHDCFRSWSSSDSTYSSNAWYLYFYSRDSGQAYWYSTTKTDGFPVAFWRFSKPD